MSVLRIRESHGIAKLRLEYMREMVDGGGAANLDGALMDVFTASAMVQIADALSEANRERFLTMPIVQMVDVGWKLVARTSK